jgi:DNA-binding winged helix-turn-helix (wHTH) protein
MAREHTLAVTATVHPVAAPVGGLIGRETELDALGMVLDEAGPRVLFVHGIGGVGKSALVEAFSARLRSEGTTVIDLDAGAVEPTARGFNAAVSAATAGRPRGAGGAVIVVDSYELLQPIDLWLRQTFVPAMPVDTRLVLTGRRPPVPDWRMGLGDWFASLALENLERAPARELLRRDGIGDDDLDRIERLARGHPLALRLAAAALTAGAPGDREAAPMSAILERLTELYLAGLDPSTRTALDAASVVRRTTRSVLAAMLPGPAGEGAFEQLRALPFVELGRDGLMVHDTVRETVSAYLRATDPDRWRTYRIAAWRQLRGEVARAGHEEMWRCTADLLYILENPVIRDVFFPTTEHRYSVDVARPGDWPAIEAVAKQTQSLGAMELLANWWQRNPMGFRVARDAHGEIGGLEVRELDTLPRSLVDLDPVARRWRDHLRTHPVPAGQHVLLNRYDITVADEAAGRLAMAALMMDLKRTYMELRPNLRRIYAAQPQPVVGTPWEQCGFEDMPGEPVRAADEVEYPYVLDFGPASVDGWLTRLIATELRVEDDELLDVAQRQLVLDGRRVDLTKLETDVLRLLVDNRNRVVDRPTLLREAWGYDDPGGSNIVDAQVKSIRRKLGDRAEAIETVRGVGYRFVPGYPAGSPTRSGSAAGSATTRPSSTRATTPASTASQTTRRSGRYAAPPTSRR